MSSSSNCNVRPVLCTLLREKFRKHPKLIGFSGFLDILGQLTTVGDIDRDRFLGNLTLTMTTFKSILNILIIFQTGIDSCGSAARPITLQS